MRIFFLIMVCMIILLSCKRKSNNTDCNVEKITIDVKSSGKLDFYNIIDSLTIEYIKLENSAESIIGNIDKLQVVKNKFFCASGEKIFVFDSNGSFILAISKQGQGPEEYLSVADFFVDSLGSIYILDYMGQKLLSIMGLESMLVLSKQVCLDNHFLKYQMIFGQYT